MRDQDDDRIPNEHHAVRGEEGRLRRLIAEHAGEPAHETVAALARLLSAAAAPPPGGAGSAGEEAALAAFRQARSAHVVDPRKRGRITALGVAVAVLLGGGVAVAATGVPFRAPDSTPASTRPSAPPTETSRTPERAVASHHTHHSHPSTSSAPSLPPSTPDSAATSSARGQRLLQLCRAYRQRLDAQHRVDLASAGFRPLARAAGGPSQVDAYCGALIDRSPAGPSAPRPAPRDTERPRETGAGGAGHGATPHGGDPTEEVSVAADSPSVQQAPTPSRSLQPLGQLGERVPLSLR